MNLFNTKHMCVSFEVIRLSLCCVDIGSENLKIYQNLYDYFS